MKASARDVLGELTREKPERYRHLTDAGLEPKPPVTVAGKAAEELIDWYETELLPAARKQDASYHRKSDGVLVERKQASTVTILGCTVIGLDEAPSPHSRRQHNFEERLVPWAKNHYGDLFVGLYRHDDEPLVHWHLLFADEGRQIKEHMAGHAAARFATSQGDDGKTAQEKLKTANKRLQDEFHAEVGVWVGLARTGPTPENGRKSRKKWKLDKLKEEHERELNAMQLAMKRALEKKDEEIERERFRAERAEAAKYKAVQKAEAIESNVREWARRKYQQLDLSMTLRDELLAVLDGKIDVGGTGGKGGLTPGKEKRIEPREMPAGPELPD